MCGGVMELLVFYSKNINNNFSDYNDGHFLLICMYCKTEIVTASQLYFIKNIKLVVLKIY